MSGRAAALAARARRVIAKLIRTQCRNKDLADTAVVAVTADPRPVVAIHPAEARPAVAIRLVVGVVAIHPAEARLVVAIRLVAVAAAIHPVDLQRAVLPLAATARPAMAHLRPRLPATARRNKTTAATRAPVALPARLLKRARRCCGPALAVVACCCSA